MENNQSSAILRLIMNNLLQSSGLTDMLLWFSRPYQLTDTALLAGKTITNPAPPFCAACALRQLVELQN